MAEPIRVLVFGTVGAGKTSMCNTLAGLEPGDPRYMETSNSAQSVTLEAYHYKEFHWKGKGIVLTDTAGLVPGQSIGRTYKFAIANIIKLLRDSQDGYNLLIYVSPPKIEKKLAEDSYNLFYKVLGGERVKIILVVTHIDLIDATGTNIEYTEKPFVEWLNANRKNYSNYKYADIIATCFKCGGFIMKELFGELRTESRKAVLDAIVKHGQGGSIKLKEPTIFEQGAVKIMNTFLDLTVIAKDKQVTYDEDLAKELEEKWGFTRDEAVKFINGI